MKFVKIATAIVLSVTTLASFADTTTSALDLSSGSTFLGRTPVGSFTDTYTFTLTGSSYFINGSATSAAIGTQDLDFSSLLLETAAGVTVGAFVADASSTDANESYKLPIMTLAAGSYKIVLSGLNSDTAASYSGNIVVAPVSAVPEPESYALLLAGLGAIGFVARRRQAN